MLPLTLTQHSSHTAMPNSNDTTTGLGAIDALLHPFNRDDAPGLIVGIAREGRILYRRAVGMASIEQGVALTPRTRVRIASTSKHFTALAVLLLAEEGKLDIDDLVYQHLPELPVLSRSGPTLRQLMQHTGGCRADVGSLAQGLAIAPTEDWTQPVHAAESELNFEPGSRMIYSNGGYQWLARVIERVSGQRFEQFMQQRIFAPLGMVDTESVSSDLDIRPGMAAQYQALPAAAGGGLRRGIYPGELRGSGSLVSTVDDMLRWLVHLRSPDKLVGSAASWKQMLALPTLSTGVEIPYGLGLMRHPYRGVEVIHHAGAVLGATSQMITVPAHRLDIMILVNGAAISPVALGFKIIDALLGDTLLGAPIAYAQTSEHPALLGQRYHAATTGAVIGFEDVGGKLGLSWMGARAAPLRQGADSLYLACEDVALHPIAIPLEALASDGAPDAITVSEGGNLLHCEWLPAAAPDLAPLAAALAGRYRIPDIEAEARIELAGEVLLLRAQGRHGRCDYRLQALSADVLLATPTDPMFEALGGNGTINIDRVAGQVVGLRIDTARVRHLRCWREASNAGRA
jgi:D-aminopeptidase